MSKRIGAQTTARRRPRLDRLGGVAGQKEKEGPYGAKFDWIIPDELNGEQSFEGAERAMLEQAVVLCSGKSGNAAERNSNAARGRSAQPDHFRRICGA